ncbi:MAG TPA: hypothetical protein ENF75_02120 [Acidilobales archaeon]|nr:MAG: hypothetical protein B6U85_04155 [Desulfurococcales archaeon ex4484_42]HDD25868.1 hypothetical protein [Acidilobales archaeon]
MPVEIHVILSNDNESEVTLRNAWEASQILFKQYGIEAYVIPINMWHSNDSLPQVLIDGECVVSGRVPTVDEIIDLVLNNCIKAPKKKKAMTYEVPGASLRYGIGGGGVEVYAF